MKRFDMRVVFGVVMIVAGGMFLLQNLGIFYGGVSLLWATLVGGAGVASLYAYANNRENWWTLIPGTTLVAIALNIVLSVISHDLSDFLGGSIVLGGIALSFWLIYFTQRGSFWWAIIPAGTLTSIAFSEFAENIFRGRSDGIFLLGMGLTFIFIATLPGYEKRLKWAFIPGWILLAIGVLSLPFIENAFSILFPLALIGAGGYVIYKNFKN